MILDKVIKGIGLIYLLWGGANLGILANALATGGEIPGIPGQDLPQLVYILDVIIIAFINSLSLAGGVGLILLRWWGRYIAIALAATAGIVSTLFLPQGFILIAVNLGIIYLLSTEEAKNLFTERKGKKEGGVVQQP